MANMASVAYAIEGSEKSLTEILGAICLAITDGKYWDEYSTCLHLGFTEDELEDKRLGGDMNDEPEIVNGVLRLSAEERWGLQDFEKILRQKFPDIKVYWQVEECGCEVYATNDKEGKYFPERYWVDTCINGEYQSEYFITEKGVYDWLSEITEGRIKDKEDVEEFNAESEDSDDFIYIHEFDIED